MDIHALIDTLTRAFNAEAAADFDAHVLLQIGQLPERVLLYVSHGTLECSVAAPSAGADFTLYFDSFEQAAKLLTGQADPVAAFMAHQFRADGYLIWVFSMLAIFRS